eukprot:TRINITY_DN6611_c0_g3_i1.p1 TRINITY_DN6611_c0_g3~~TRINITY_DN6611_c0_g3_i1.p1  ORF type:complete len:321 (-),score=25.88 TRINITY_DN6611_c0_g3_i1:119-1081(-)
MLKIFKFCNKLTAFGFSPKFFTTISSGHSGLDQILGGGFEKGSTIEIIGEAICGKTTLALQIIKQIQKSGGVALYADTDYSMNQYFLNKTDINYNQLLFCQPNTAEILFEVIHNFIEEKIELVCIDSLASILPEKELNSGLNSRNLKQNAFLKKNLPEIVELSKQNGTILVLINQIRREKRTNDQTLIDFENSGVPNKRLMQKFCDVRIGICQQKQIFRNMKITGILSKLQIIQNKDDLNVGESTDFEILFQNAKLDSLLNLATELKIVKLFENQFYYEKFKLGQEIYEAVETLENLRLVNNLQNDVILAQNTKTWVSEF